MRCSAKTTGGKPCRNYAIRGGNVCSTHGGSAPQVKAKALERLAALVDPALAALSALVRKGKVPAVQLAAAKDILDRAGYKPSDKTEISGPDGKSLLVTVRFRDPDPEKK